MSLLIRLLIASLFLFILSIAVSQDRSTIEKRYTLLKEYQEADALFNKAEKISDDTRQDQLNHQALAAFKLFLPKLNVLNDDSLAFRCYFKTGILEHYFGNFSEANLRYNQAISFINKIPFLKDSSFFPALLYSGIIYYQQSLFDSALLRLKQAEEIDDRYESKLKESERLYNNLGVLYYEMGNYRQGKNYFRKAIAVLQPSNIYFKPLFVNYKINLAQALTKLEDYNAAYSIYQEIISFNISHNEIYHNLGTIQLALGLPKEAIDYFRKVNYNEAKIIKLSNDMAFAFYNLKQFDSCHFYLQQASNENAKRNGNRRNVAHGLTLKYTGDLLSAEGNFSEALKNYQQAILNFDDEFQDSSVASQPTKFSGIISFNNLFDAISAKAFVSEKLFEQQKKQNWLELALNAYRSAFLLANHIQKTYETDEARLFLNQVKYRVHARPIDVAVKLYELTKDKKYLEEAYRFDQLNKASVLSLGLQEVSLEKQAGVSNDLLKQINERKSVIAQLNLKAAKTADSSLTKLITDQLRDEEIKLARLQEQINSNPKYALLDPAEKIPSVSALQDLLDKHTLLLSYQLHENELTCFYFTHKEFDYHRQNLDQYFFQHIDTFLKQLRSVNNAEKYAGASSAVNLYKILIKPLSNQLIGITQLIIIPDDELNYLPFEALQYENGNYLVEKFSIQYQYSTALLNLHLTKKPGTGVIAFAPFAESGNNSFESLKFSKEEVQSAHGKILLAQEASKGNFLRLANHYPVIHLATHASVNDSNPNQSFIAFYPQKADSGDYKLYAGEIYDLKLDSTKLVILSACETGAGRLVRGEGLMSLSRAFAYSGCPNIVTSLWKAEDRTTAFIAQRLYFYLDKDLSPGEALQKAKIDLLHDNQIDPSLKTPNYWAHLVFIGDYEKSQSSNTWWWIAGLIIILSTAAIIMKKRSR